MDLFFIGFGSALCLVGMFRWLFKKESPYNVGEMCKIMATDMSVNEDKRHNWIALKNTEKDVIICRFTDRQIKNAQDRAIENNKDNPFI